MSRRKLICGLTFVNAAVFVLTVHFFLPTRASYSPGPVERYFHSRTEWSIAWVVLLCAVLISTGIVVIFGKSGPDNQK
jgi:heme/copper-type cytochrome/quinol oxidase subunit 2